MIFWLAPGAWFAALLLDRVITDVIRDGAGGTYEDDEHTVSCAWCNCCATKFTAPGSPRPALPSGWLGPIHDSYWCSLRCQIEHAQHLEDFREEGKTT